MNSTITTVVLSGLIAIAGLYWYITSPSSDLETNPLGHHFYKYQADGRTIAFNLHDPETAPPEIRQQVMLGYHIMINTGEYAKEYVGNRLSCINCHFCAGNTTGGRNGSISLVGVTTSYPTYSERDKRDITLTDRIENCFQRSMNGSYVPEDSKEMKAVLAYLEWISQDVAKLKDLPWLGLRMLKSSHEPDAKKGSEVYDVNCAKCHGPDGQGTEAAPPLWGPGSFNDGAGMNTLPRLSAFVYDNMPYQAPELTVEQALDVAAFIISQPRPHFEKQNIKK